MGGIYCQQTEKVSYVFVTEEKNREKIRDIKSFPCGLPACFLNSLHCSVILWNMILNQETFKKTKKKAGGGKSLSSKHILRSSGSNLISVKRKNKVLPIFGMRLAGSFSGALFRNGPSGQMWYYIMLSSSFPQRNCSCFMALEKQP